MAGLLPCEPSPYGSLEGTYNVSDESSEEGGGRWYFSRKDIEEDSPSRRDGIGSRKETYLRKSYCTFLQDLGMRLIVPQLTIATAIVFCHRFFLHQSHAKNDRRTIATVCMFLAGKVEETPRPLKDVVLVSYEIIHKRDAAAVQRIRQKEVYEPQKELILLGERVVLATLGFDLNIHHPYKPLVEAIKKFEVADQNALAKVAWNFVNDGLRTSLCVQFKPHHVAAGAIFLAAKFLKVKLPHVWWQEFNVTPGQLEEISNQTLELYEQYEVPPSRASEAKGGARASEPPAALKSAANEQHITSYNSALRPAPLWPIPESRANHQNEHRHRYLTDKDSTFGHSPQDGNKNLDREKPKAAFERRKALGDTTFKMDLKDGLERELEDVEVPCNCDKTKCEQIMSKCSNSTEAIKGHSSGVDDIDTVDRGELELFDDGEKGYQSPSSGLCKRKRDSPLHNPMGGKHKQNHLFGNKEGKRKSFSAMFQPFTFQHHHGYPEDTNKLERHRYSERDLQRHLPEDRVRNVFNDHASFSGM